MTLMEMNELIEVREVDAEDIPSLRESVLTSVGKTYEELLDKEHTYSLSREEAAALLELRGLNFLAGE